MDATPTMTKDPETPVRNITASGVGTIVNITKSPIGLETILSEQQFQGGPHETPFAGKNKSSLPQKYAMPARGGKVVASHRPSGVVDATSPPQRVSPTSAARNLNSDLKGTDFIPANR